MGYVPGNETNNIPFGIPLALGKYTELQGVNKFGYNSAVGTSFATIWEGITPYPYITTPGTVTLVSSNTAADNGGTVTVSGLDADWNQVSEQLIIGGASGVVNFQRVYRMVMNNATTGTSNVGTVTASVTGVVRAYMNPGYSQSLMALYTIPAGYRGFILSFNASPGKQKEMEARLMIREHDGVNVFNTISYNTTFGARFDHRFEVYQCLKAQTDIEIQCKVDATSGVSAGFELILEKI